MELESTKTEAALVTADSVDSAAETAASTSEIKPLESEATTTEPVAEVTSEEEEVNI